MMIDDKPICFLPLPKKQFTATHSYITMCIVIVVFLARMPEWSKGVDLRSTGFGRVGSNPTSCILLC